jgi:hypothetical protein
VIQVRHRVRNTSAGGSVCTAWHGDACFVLPNPWQLHQALTSTLHLYIVRNQRQLRVGSTGTNHSSRNRKHIV